MLLVLSGCGTIEPSGNLTATPASISFGAVAVGKTASATISLANSGTAAVEIQAVHTTGSGFHTGSQARFPVTVPAKGSYALPVEFAPTAAGSATGQVAVTSNAAVGGTITIALGGTATSGSTVVAGAALRVDASAVAFGTVTLHTPATQAVVLTSSGTAPLTISGISTAGTGFSATGVSAPLTLNPGQTATVDVEFNPAAAGAATGTLTIASNAANGGTVAIGLSGTGAASSGHSVDLNWNAPTDQTDPVVGYQVYREAAGGSAFTLLDNVMVVTTTYSDTTVQSGTTYTYEVTSVDAQGNQSVPSNIVTVAVP